MYGRWNGLETLQEKVGILMRFITGRRNHETVSLKHRMHFSVYPFLENFK